MSKFELKEILKHKNYTEYRYNQNDMFDIIHQGEINILKKKILSGVDINLRNDEDQTLLHYAMLYRQTEITKFLLSSGARLDTKDRNGQTVKEVIQNYYPDLLELHYSQNIIDNTSEDQSSNQVIIGDNKCEICVIF